MASVTGSGATAGAVVSAYLRDYVHQNQLVDTDVADGSGNWSVGLLANAADTDYLITVYNNDDGTERYSVIVPAGAGPFVATSILGTARPDNPDPIPPVNPDDFVLKTTTVNGHPLSANVNVSKTDVGLANVDNTSDTSKPVSTATSTALNLRVLKSTQSVNVKDYGATGDGVTNDTTSIQAAIDAAGYGGEVYFPRGNYSFSTLTLNHSQKLRGDGWHFLRDAVTTFGSADYTNANGLIYIQGSVLRSTTTSGFAITHVGSGGNNIMEGHIQNLALIGPGSGTSAGVTVGNGTITVVDATYRNILIANFATGLVLNAVNEGRFYDVKIQGCTKAVSGVTVVNSNAFYSLNIQRCTDGFVFEDTTSTNNAWYSPIFQNVSGTAMLMRGRLALIMNPYFEGCPIPFDYVAQLSSTMFAPTFQGAGTKTSQIRSGSNNNLFWNLETSAAQAISNAGTANSFQGTLTGVTGAGANPVLWDSSNGTFSYRNFIAPSTVGPSFQAGSSFGFRFGASGSQILQGTGSPEGVITAPVGSIFLRTDGAGSSTLYTKESGSGNTGWTAEVTRVSGITTVADANYTALTTDMIVSYTSISAARVLTLPSVSAASGRSITIKDQSGSCSITNTITITPASGNIDGAGTLVLNSSYGKATVYSNGTNWFTR